jgi:hypothetical protein
LPANQVVVRTNECLELNLSQQPSKIGGIDIEGFIEHLKCRVDIGLLEADPGVCWGILCSMIVGGI